MSNMVLVHKLKALLNLSFRLIIVSGELATDLKCLLEKINDFAERIKTRLIISMQKGHYENDGVIVIGRLKCAMYWDAVVTRIGDQWFVRKHYSNIYLMRMHGLRYLFQRDVRAVLYTNCIYDLSVLEVRG
jgi:hypothetical protein